MSVGLFGLRHFVSNRRSLFNGLFHPIHDDGFLSLRGTVKYATSNDEE